MVNITNAELWAFNVLNNSINSTQAELQRAIASREAYVKLLEGKYHARFNPEDGKFYAQEHQAKKVKEKE